MAMLEQPLGWTAVPPARAALAQTLGRYGVSSLGPVAVSGAHFLASLVFLRNLPAREFGLFSFVLVIVPFCMSLCVSLICVPLTQNLTTSDLATRSACFKMNGLLCVLYAVAIFAALRFGQAPARVALILALFGAVFAWRWFARCFAYVENRIVPAIASDLLYGFLLAAALTVLALTGRVTLLRGSIALLASALAALVPFGSGLFREQITALRTARLSDYRPIFRDLTRWSLTGMVLTEATVNAHAYLVTFTAGPGAFALLALGMLLMRPAALVQGALPDLERPAMARAIAARDWSGLARIARHFRIGLGATWLATLLAGTALLAWAPQLLLKKGYLLDEVALVAALTAAIMAVRVLRTPLSVLLQAAGEFKALAGIGLVSSAVSVSATLGLLLAFGPIASLGGVLLGELVILLRCRLLAGNWGRHHG
jgi:putative peptidoglycan lipid II flippase